VRSLQVRALTSEYLTAALDLDRRCLGGLWNLDGYQREIDSPNSDLIVLQQIESLNSEHPTPAPRPLPALVAIGCSWAILEEAHITLLAVDLDYQQQGLGQALLYYLLKAAHDRGLERATLEVRVSNQAAIALYEKFGFQTAGRRKRYYAQTGEDALVLWRGGLHHPHFPQTLATWQQVARDRLRRSGWQLQED
jgi:[ribosomal protein S18]-alanine N-acetyltransferase